jgi:hypothetical protein
MRSGKAAGTGARRRASARRTSVASGHRSQGAKGPPEARGYTNNVMADSAA